jgi:hypothetical protein
MHGMSNLILVPVVAFRNNLGHMSRGPRSS